MFFLRRQPAYTSSLIKFSATSSLVPQWVGDTAGWTPRTPRCLCLVHLRMGLAEPLHCCFPPSAPSLTQRNKNHHSEVPAQNMGDWHLFFHKSAAEICGHHGLTTVRGFSPWADGASREWKLQPAGQNFSASYIKKSQQAMHFPS